MRMIIVDDELLQVETIEEYLYEIHPDAEIRAFREPVKALEGLKKQAADIAFLDIKLPGGINGIQLAIQMKCIVPDIKIIFCTGYSEYAVEAFRIHANGYLCKPIMKEDLQKELEYLLSETEISGQQKPFLHTFGNFDVFINGDPVLFRRQKSKEALAWITDRKGTWVTNNELMAAIWDDYYLDTPIEKYASLLIKEMIKDLERYGIGYVVERKRGKIRLCTERVDCDYISMITGDVKAINQFHGEYMSQYSWGENTLSNLLGTTYL